MIKLVLFCFLNILLFQQKPKNAQEEIITKKVEALPEVKHWLNQELKDAKPALIVDHPDKDSKYYVVHVGFNGQDRFGTEYSLSVNPKTYQIYFIDVMDINVKSITLKQWRYWRTKPGFNKPHYYKNGKLIVLKD